MTGHGRAVRRDKDWIVAVDCSSVNRKGLEVVFQLPRELATLEPRLREEAGRHLRRGRLNILVSVSPASGAAAGCKISLETAAAAWKNLKDVAKHLKIPGEPTLESLLRHPAICCQSANVGSGPREELVLECLRAALVPLLEMRAKEGANLAQELRHHAKELRALCAAIAEESPRAVKRYANGLREKIARLLPPSGTAPERIEQEIVLYADRADISEEIARLSSHLDQFEATLDAGESAGRTLEFLAQEMGREINTCSAKSNSAEIARLVIRAKSTLEKIREQLANIE